MLKRAIIIILFTLLAALAACTPTASNPNDDLLAPLPTPESVLPTLLDLLSEDPNLVFFLNSLSNVGLTDDLQSGGPFTIFAPSNVAFSKAGLIVSQTDLAVLGEIVDQHLVDGDFSEAALIDTGSVLSLVGESLPISQDGEAVKVGNVSLAGEARQASNGMLFVIDTLLLPSETGAEKSMWGVLQADGRFSTLVSLIEKAGLVETLRFDDEIDAFLAPTDEAFAKMPADMVTFLENDPRAIEILIRYHFLTPNGWPEDVNLMIADLAQMEAVEASIAIGSDDFNNSIYMSGLAELAITSTDAGLQIGQAMVLTGDLEASNGVVHAIDTVLIPEILLEHMSPID